MLISEAMEKGRIELKSNNIELPKLKSRLLMQYVLGQNRQYVIVHDDEKLEKNMEEKYFANIKKIKEGTPIEHITHQKEFMKLNFYVDSDDGPVVEIFLFNNNTYLAYAYPFQNIEDDDLFIEANKWYSVDVDTGDATEYTGDCPFIKSIFTDIYSSSYLDAIVESFGN